jgi:hypothetical protein
MSEPRISGLPTVHWLKYPELYGADEIKPLTVQVTSEPCKNALRSALANLEFCMEQAEYTGGNHLGEYLDRVQRVSLEIESIIKGREVPGMVLVKRSGGWIKRRVKT